MSTSLRLCSLAPFSRILCARPLRRGEGTGSASSFRRYFAVSDRGSAEAPVVAGVNHLATLLAGPKPDVDEVIRDANHCPRRADDEDVFPWSRSWSRMSMSRRLSRECSPIEGSSST